MLPIVTVPLAILGGFAIVTLVRKRSETKAKAPPPRKTDYGAHVDSDCGALIVDNMAKWHAFLDAKLATVVTATLETEPGAGSNFISDPALADRFARTVLGIIAPNCTAGANPGSRVAGPSKVVNGSAVLPFNAPNVQKIWYIYAAIYAVKRTTDHWVQDVALSYFMKIPDLAISAGFPTDDDAKATEMLEKAFAGTVPLSEFD